MTGRIISVRFPSPSTIRNATTTSSLGGGGSGGGSGDGRLTQRDEVPRVAVARRVVGAGARSENQVQVDKSKFSLHKVFETF